MAPHHLRLEAPIEGFAELSDDGLRGWVYSFSVSSSTPSRSKITWL